MVFPVPKSHSVSHTSTHAHKCIHTHTCHTFMHVHMHVHTHTHGSKPALVLSLHRPKPRGLPETGGKSQNTHKYQPLCSSVPGEHSVPSL